MKKLTIRLFMIFQIVVLSCFSGCKGGGEVSESTSSVTSETLETMQLVETYNDDALDKYMNPIWQTSQIYDEGGVVA